MMPGVSAVAAGAAGWPAGVTGDLAQAGKDQPTTPFADLVSNAIGQVDLLDTQANAAVTGLMSSNGVDVHQAMIATEKASMAFELALAVRSKAVQAYHSVMSMQF